jgi:hypothetical protein
MIPYIPAARSEVRPRGESTRDKRSLIIIHVDASAQLGPVAIPVPSSKLNKLNYIKGRYHVSRRSVSEQGKRMGG